MATERVAFTVKEVAESLGFTEESVRRHIREGEIPARLIGRRKMIPAEWLREQSSLVERGSEA